MIYQTEMILQNSPPAKEGWLRSRRGGWAFSFIAILCPFGILKYLLIICIFLLINPMLIFSQTKELLTNPGFENNDISMWVKNDCEVNLTNTEKKSGVGSLSVSDRKTYFSSPNQDITKVLEKYGPGKYSFSAYLKLTKGQLETPMYVVISIETTEGPMKWFTSTSVKVNDKDFIQSAIANLNISWAGTLKKALIYIQNVDVKVSPNYFVDDFSLLKTSPIIKLTTETVQTIELRDAGSPAIGAIRWDAWLPKPDSVGSQVAKSLGPSKYHFRLPYFAIVKGDNEVDFPKYTQEIFDAEIKYAEHAGLDYWAYCWYPIGNTMETARNLHVTSKLRDRIKMCAVLAVNPFGDKERVQLVGYFKENFYKKVQGGRPLVYFFENKNSLPIIVAMQKDCADQGIPMPYFVSMREMSTGFDAVSGYATSGSGGISFKQLAQSAESNWNSQKNKQNQIIPLITTGWDNRPRFDNQVSWHKVTADSWAQTGTANEIASHVQNGVNWTKNNIKLTLANAVLIYAWNEHDEGGWLCPTIQVDANGNVLKKNGVNLINTDRIDAMHNILKK